MAIKKNSTEAAEVKAEAAAATEKKTTARKTAGAKKPVAKTEEKPAARKAAAEKPEEKKAEPKESVVIQYGAKEAVIRDVVATAVEAYKAAHEGVEIKTVDVYVKPEENAVYYVVNGDDSEGNNKIELF